MKTTPRTEDYLKHIYILSKTQEVHGANLADALELSRPTVCVALKSLESQGYITMDGDRVISLTSAGRKIGENTYEKNIIFHRFLVNMGVDEAIARKDACRLEHAVSPESFAVFREIVQKQDEGKRIHYPDYAV